MPRCLENRPAEMAGDQVQIFARRRLGEVEGLHQIDRRNIAVLALGRLGEGQDVRPAVRIDAGGCAENIGDGQQLVRLQDGIVRFVDERDVGQEPDVDLAPQRARPVGGLDDLGLALLPEHRLKFLVDPEPRNRQTLFPA
jgi:hypothetical protein